MENYKQKYEEALERARVVNPGTKDYNIVTTIFPELKESEDERIRKEIIHYLDREITLSNFGRDIATFKEWIAWLEKQGEQKLTNKVKPKFKVGDWIVNNYNHIAYIESISEIKYNLQYKDGYHESISIDYVDIYWRIWTIQDAKIGDMLEFADHGRIVIGIVSNVNKVIGKVDTNCLLEDNNFKLGNFYALDTIKPHPTTKEQCVLLFSKMKEAGYEWDAEKKELREISKN